MPDLSRKITTDTLLIVGAGPSGLLLGHLLYQYGIPFHIIEKNASTHQHSRAIGIHPVSLAIFHKLGLLNSFLEQGLKIQKGAAYLNRTWVGSIDFSLTAHAYPFILSLPQYTTENILRERLLTSQPGCISYDTELAGLRENDHGVRVFLRPTGSGASSGHSSKVTVPYLVGCDGRDSRVRSEISVDWKGRQYPDRYVMGDFVGQPDTDIPAMIHLHPRGVVESFSMPEDQQRWVVKISRNIHDDPLPLLKREVYRRVGIDLSTYTCLRSSRFGVEQYRASRFYHNRCLLAGDAAHVVNPIGGQGMNLGWLGVQTLAKSLRNIYRGDAADQHLNTYNRIQQHRARKSFQRATLNMKIGRSFRWKTPRKWLLQLLLNTPLNHLTARAFTMHGLDRWPM